MINRYSNPEDPERNPIHVLQSFIPNEVSEISEELKGAVAKLIEEGKLNSDLINWDHKEDVIDISPLTMYGGIVINDRFQMFLWCFCYCTYVYHVEYTIKRNNNYQTGRPDHEGIDKQRVRTAMELFDYGMGLLNKYEKWNESLPNPAVYPLAEDATIKTVDAIYLKALNFVIGHEIAHNELGHTGHAPGDPEGASILIEESQADQRSIEYINDGITGITEAVIQVGLLTALCAMLLSAANHKKTSYPDADERIATFIEHAPLPVASDLWAIAVLAFKLWASYYGHALFFPQNLGSQKEVYQEIRKQLMGITHVQVLEVVVSGERYKVLRYPIGKTVQISSYLDGITVTFERQETGKIFPLLNGNHVEESFLKNFIEELEKIMCPLGETS